jgi:hypothetical protein
VDYRDRTIIKSIAQATTTFEAFGIKKTGNKVFPKFKFTPTSRPIYKNMYHFYGSGPTASVFWTFVYLGLPPSEFYLKKEERKQNKRSNIIVCDFYHPVSAHRFRP